MFWIALIGVAAIVVLVKCVAETFWLAALRSALLQLGFWLAVGLGFVALWRRLTRRGPKPKAAPAN